MSTVLEMEKDGVMYMSNLIEFPSGAALQVQKDRMKATRPVNNSVEHQLVKLARFYIDMNKITGTEVIYSDVVANTALDFVKEVCDVVGFHQPKGPSAA